ncbi:MAG: sodium/solute symporter, partial [Saprospiraceae bacterium]|nr:sodium/solute symporter [Saprospiraceae bacterium]
EEAIKRLANQLFSADSNALHYAAYGLGFIRDLPTVVLDKLKNRLRTMDRAHPSRIYLLSALWKQQKEVVDTLLLEEILTYRTGRNNERYEVFQAFSQHTDASLIPLIEQSFDDPDPDVKSSVAQAFLANEQHQQGHTGWIDWFILIIYAMVLLLIGWIYSKYQKNKEDYFLGGRKVNPVVSGISMYVSFFSAITYLAIAGEVIKNGPLMPLITITAAPFIFLLGSYVLIPYFMNLKMISAYEILDKPLGNHVRKLGSIIFLLTRIVWMALLVFLASKAMVVMMNWQSESILLISVVLGLITIVYTTMGGIKAVLVTDVIQFMVLLTGALLTTIMVAVQFDGFSGLIPEKWSPQWQSVEFFNFNPYIRLTVFFAFINVVTWWVCTTGSDQMAIQRFMSTRDLRSARKSFAITQGGMVLMTSILMFVGFSVLKFYDFKPNLLPQGKDLVVSADFLFPHFIATQFPMGMSGLVMAALFSASMSSLSSGINSTASVLNMDLLPTFLQSDRDADELKKIRFSSFILGVIVIVISLVIPLVPGNIIEVTAKTNGLFIAPLFNLFFMALFYKRSTTFGVMMGSVYGFLMAFTIAFWDILTGYPAWSFLWIAISSLLVSVLSSILFSQIFGRLVGKKVLWPAILLLIPWFILFLII